MFFWLGLPFLAGYRPIPSNWDIDEVAFSSNRQMIAEQRKLPGESSFKAERREPSGEPCPFTGGLAPNRFQKPLGVRRKHSDPIFPKRFKMSI